MIDRSRTIHWIGWLIMTYIFLLMIEGALRKWILPRYSDPLLVVRDPVLLAIYWLALRARVFPRNWWVITLFIIGIFSLVFSVLFLSQFLAWPSIAAITLYGFRANFLHLPLIFLMAKIFDEEDVKKIGWWILLGMIPLGLLMVLQFKSSPDSFINSTAGAAEGAEQLTAGGGKIRPPGTFSFISGPVYYCAMATAFLIYGILSRAAYKTWLLVAGSVALVIAVAVSGSRACVASVALVALTTFVIFAIRPKAVNQVGRVILVGIVVAFIISRLPVFEQGLHILSDRFITAAEEGDSDNIILGLVSRTFAGFTEGLKNLDQYQAGGWGLGLGTNVGAHFLVGGPGFLLSENEWTRLLYEMGPVLGLAYILWRTALTVRLGYLSIRALTRGMTLPLLLFASGFLALLEGQLGQPTSLGFAVVLCGLCLASMQGKGEGKELSFQVRESQPMIPPPRPVPRTSPHAARLHQNNNGFIDR
jgi:hypothetical protein